MRGSLGPKARPSHGVEDKLQRSEQEICLTNNSPGAQGTIRLTRAFSTPCLRPPASPIHSYINLATLLENLIEASPEPFQGRAWSFASRLA